MLNVDESLTAQENHGENRWLLSWNKTNERIVSFFTVVLIAVFPLVFRNFYFDILTVKYIFYYRAVLLMTGALFLVALFFLYGDGRYHQWKGVKHLCESFRIKSLKPVDWAMLVFLGAVTISTCQSDYFYESFWGNEGRFMGLFLMILYTVSYFMLSRFLRFKQWYLDVFLGTGMIVCIIGILQYFDIDPIGFKENMIWEQYKIFASTIGNINTYTAYVALVAGMGTALFILEKNRIRRYWYLATVMISLLALITGISDNAYLTMAVIFGLLPLYLFNHINGVRKYLLLVSILFTEFQLIDSLNQAFPEQVLGIKGLFNIIVGYEYLSWLVIALWCITIVLSLVEARGGNLPGIQRRSNLGRWVWFGAMAAVILGVCYVLYDVNILGNTEAYGSLKKYLVINDDWGTHRWYIWRIGMESYGKFPLLHKLFGHGPDTFGIITMNNYYGEMVARYRERFDSMHNEYLQYLVTIGIAGLLAYLSLLASSVTEMVRTSKRLPVVLAVVFALLCYWVQEVVNISVPIVAPITMVLLAMGVAAGKADTGEIASPGITSAEDQ